MRIFFKILLCIVYLKSFSQNNLILYSHSGKVFKAYFDGRVLNENDQASVLIQHILKDTVKVKIEFADKTSGTETFYLLEKKKPAKNVEFNYSVDAENGKVKFAFEGIKQITNMPEPLVPPKPIVDTTMKYRNNVLGHYCELKEGKAIFYNNSSKSGECETPMPDSYLNYLNILMSKAQIEDDKFNIAENTTRNNCVSIEQLNKILSYIDFEIEKLRLIKLSYLNLTDKQNVKSLESTFKLESSKRELESFLKGAANLKRSSNVSCSVASKDPEIDEYVKSLSVYNNDGERYQAFKKTHVNFCYTSIQIKSVLKTFVHDREKLDAAELLYFHCTEKEKFLEISDVFSYNYSSSELKSFVDKQQN